ncbi:MAG: TRAP transporter small permease subunit [Pseudomonadales bacterium]|nr:TRAP transporter small permease subunit [Betaproteobacteria bacterium]MBP9032401.1 TRAP transporter small permease subunit [Pseudomonadales bacterium]
MRAALTRASGWFMHFAASLAAFCMGAMFVCFIVGVFARYILRKPVAWADELSVIMGIWVILWGTAFVTREVDNIRFDMIYGGVSPGMRRVFDAVTGLALVVLFSIAFPATLSYVNFMKVEVSAALGVRFDLVFSVYVIFAAAMIARHLWIVWCAIRGRPAFDDQSPAALENIE